MSLLPWRMRAVEAAAEPAGGGRRVERMLAAAVLILAVLAGVFAGLLPR